MTSIAWMLLFVSLVVAVYGMVLNEWEIYAFRHNLDGGKDV